MQVGDLVALSAYGEQLIDLRVYSGQFRAEHYSKQPLMGIIVKRLEIGGNNPKPSRVPFRVEWLNESNPYHCPQGRGGRFGPSYFFRKDLKKVRATPKQKPS